MAYDLWNALLETRFFGTEQPHATVLFHVDEDVLLDVARGGGVDFATPDEARADFVLAVRDELERRGRHDAWAPGPVRAGATPTFFGLLAIQVLAVYSMHEDDDSSVKAYWIRLAQLLDRVDDQSSMLTEIYREQQNLWRGGLEAWANRLRGGKFGCVSIPADGVAHRHVRLPKTQALLRRVDLEGAESSFWSLRWRPGMTLAEAVVRRSLHVGDFKTAHGQRVWADPLRQPLAVRQVVDHVGFDWIIGGRGSDSKTTAAATRAGVRAWFYLDKAELRLRSGLMVPDADGVWVDERRLPQPKMLGTGRAIRLPEHGYAPLRPDRVLAVLDEGLGHYFVEQLWATPGDTVVLLVPEADSAKWWVFATFVAEGPEVFLGTSQARGAGTVLRGLPQGWACISLTVGERPNIAAAGPWAAVLRAPHRIQLRGGLKLQLRTWLAGAGPTVAFK